MTLELPFRCHNLSHAVGPSIRQLKGKELQASIRSKDFARSVLETKANVAGLPSSVQGWVTVDLDRHAYALGAEFTYSEPFYCQDGIWRVISDYQPEAGFSTASSVLSFRGLQFSVNALLSSMELLAGSENTNALEAKLAESLARGDTLQICQKVCEWGGSTGGRVWGNLQRYCNEIGDTDCVSLRDALRDWLRDAAIQSDARLVIAKGAEIRGLGVSYASKHLRLLFPDKYPVLDSVLSDAFGFAMNPSGYELFVSMLQHFKSSNPEFSDRTVGAIESGFFRLIQRGSPHA